MMRSIVADNPAIDRRQIKRLLLLFEEEMSFIGDTSHKFDELRVCRSFFPGATIDINFNNPRYTTLYNALLKNSPHIDNVHNRDWKEINFLDYDLVICAVPREEALLAVLEEKYGSAAHEAPFDVPVLSLSDAMLHPTRRGKPLFPVYEELWAYTNRQGAARPHEMYVSEEERAAANGWLESMGIRPGEQLFIFLDSSSGNEKLLRTDVYFDVLAAYLQREKVRVLIFDEKGVGKKMFYDDWLGNELASKIIYSERRGLREDICLFASGYTKVIFGPCTGLMHCASGIYNNLLRNGMPPENVPVMMVYTGKYKNESDTAQVWWGGAPLVNCVVLRQNAGRAEAALLKDLNEPEKMKADNLLSCKSYNAKMITDLLDACLS